MNRRWKALIIGAAVVCFAMLLARYQVATPVPLLLLLPGMIAGACVPDSHFDLKANNSWGPISTIVIYSVNIGIYSGLWYLALRHLAPTPPELTNRPASKSLTSSASPRARSHRRSGTALPATDAASRPPDT